MFLHIYMSRIAPPLTHIQCHPSSFLLTALRNVSVPPNSREARSRDVLMQPCLSNAQDAGIPSWGALSSSLLLLEDLAFPMMIAGTDGLCFLLFALSLAPVLHPWRRLCSSSSISGFTQGSHMGLHNAISWYRV